MASPYEGAPAFVSPFVTARVFGFLALLVRVGDSDDSNQPIDWAALLLSTNPEPLEGDA
jgi:hypothetical protein